MKTIQYRLYPTKEQRRLLTRQLEECRWLWNTLLAERKQAWEDRQEPVDYYAQKAGTAAAEGERAPLPQRGALPGLAGCGAAAQEGLRRLLPSAESG